MASIFTKVIAGEIPSFKIFENEHVICILTLDQVNLGHSLVIPKKEIDHFADVPEPYYSEIFRVAKVVSKAIQKATGCVRVGAIFLGFEVHHCHLHLIPMNNMSDCDFKKGRARSHEDNQMIVEKIKENLQF